MLRNKLVVESMEEMKSLHEVKFDKDIIHEHEFKSLEQIRPVILERWYHNQNGSEGFNDSFARAKEIEAFLSKWRGKRIILVTHGWFLRLLEVQRAKHGSFERIFCVADFPVLFKRIDAGCTGHHE